ncbi:Phage protein [Staphylococcus equorum subsp. equorum]|uniref:hypothetical protein n=1 Tax=Staphylococcus equorum TaxID=246432 RepID=UPI000623E639|nr:hypothetical protein [Staphylococcus equorum]KKI55475.1 Phage protein [Staphylococcus equorum subsp. equorum]
MARKEITTPLDLKNLDNHNDNYDELYGLIDETDRRISEDMWEEIKDANTMKMLEPVQTAADLPSEAADKSLITVIDEQRVYGFVNGEWQPFSEIDLDPFSPFKDELAAIVAAYEKKIKNITTEVQNTKASAIESIESTQTQSESNINQTEQSAIDSINQTQTEAEGQISTIRDEMTTQASDLTTLFNDSMDKLTSKQDTALAEVDSAKQAAIAALEDFQNTDTTEWQKFKLTDEKGAYETVGLNNDIEQLHNLPNGHFYATSTPIDMATSSAGLLTMEERGSYSGLRRIEFRPYNSTQKFVKRKYDTWFDWEPAQGTNVELFSGSLKEMNKNISLKDDPRNYSFLIIELHQIGGDDSAFARFVKNYVVLRLSNLGNSGNGSTLIETSMKLDSADPTKIYIESSVRIETDTATGEEYVPEILKIVGVK